MHAYTLKVNQMGLRGADFLGMKANMTSIPLIWVDEGATEEWREPMRCRFGN